MNQGYSLALFDFINAGDEDVSVDIFKSYTSIDNQFQVEKNYHFNTPYVATYNIGTFFSYERNGVTYSLTLVSVSTAIQVAQQLSLLGFGIFSSNSSIVSGNVFTVKSNEFIYDNFTIRLGNGYWNSSTIPTNNNIRGIQFLNQNLGYVIDNQKLMKTIDGGLNWTSNNLPFTSFATRFFVLNSSNIWITIYDSTTSKPKVYYTSDEGLNWSLQFTGTDGIYDSIFFIDNNNGWLCSGGVDSVYLTNIFFTTDGGLTWNPQVSPTTNQLYSIIFLDSNNGWCSGQNVAMKTTDGGLNWVIQVLPFVSLNYDVKMIDVNNILISSLLNILKTTDGGLSWSVIPCMSSNVEMSVVDANNIFVCGQNGGIASVFATTDGGTTWTPQNVNSSSYPFLLHISMTSVNYGFSGGTSGNLVKKYTSESVYLRKSGLYVVGTTNINQYIFSLLNDPQYIPAILLVAENQNQLNNIINITYKDASGQMCSHPILPNISVSQFQVQGLMSLNVFDKNEFIADGTNYISQYKCNANKTMRMLILFKEKNRASLLGGTCISCSDICSKEKEMTLDEAKKMFSIGDVDFVKPSVFNKPIASIDCTEICSQSACE